MVSAPRGKLPMGRGAWLELRERRKVDVCVESKGVTGQRPKEGRTTATGKGGAGGTGTERVTRATDIRAALVGATSASQILVAGAKREASADLRVLGSLALQAT